MMAEKSIAVDDEEDGTADLGACLEKLKLSEGKNTRGELTEEEKEKRKAWKK